MTCKYCGREITNPKARFCPGCGKPLDSSPQPQNAPQNQRQTRARRPSNSRPEWDTYQDPNRWMKWVIAVVVIVVVLVAALVIWGMTFLNGESILSLFMEDKDTGSHTQSQLIDDAPSSSYSSSLATARPDEEEEEEDAYVEPAQASDSQVVLRNVPDDAVITVNGAEVDYEMVGHDAVVQRSYIPDVAQVRVIAPVDGGGWQTAAVWYNYKYGNDMTMGDSGDYGQYVSCDADGKAEPSEKVVDVLTWAYYDGFLRCINDQTLSYMAFSTATNTSDQSENVFSDANSKNIYDVDDFTAVCDPESILYQDGKVIYNAYFRSTCTRRSTGDSKQVENHRTIELVWEDGVWKVNRIAFLSEDDFNARNYAQLP